MNGLAVKMLCENSPDFSWDIVDFSTEDKPGVYCIYENESGMVYVGRTANCHTRLLVHKSQLNRGTHYNKNLQDCYNRGKDFRRFVIEYCDTIPTTNLLEVHWTRFFKSSGKIVLNITPAYSEPLSKYYESEECALLAKNLGYLNGVDANTTRLVLSTHCDPFIQSGDTGNIDEPLKYIETNTETIATQTVTMKETQATRNGYGAATIQWAEGLLLSGVEPSDVAKRTGINPGYARTLKFRLKNKEKEIEKKPAREHDSEILREFIALGSKTEIETPVTIVTEKLKQPRFKVTILDVVFYATTLTTCAGLVTLLQWWGLPVALVYSLILIDAMETAKRPELERSAQAGAAAVIIFEIIAACVHTYLFNNVLWANYRSLPFDMSQKITNGEWAWPNADKPFLIAIGIALVLSGSAVYAIEKSIVTAREKAKNIEK